MKIVGGLIRMKKVYKYATGQEIPKGAVYLNTVTQTKIKYNNPRSYDENTDFKDCFLVWHYFLVEDATQ